MNCPICGEPMEYIGIEDGAGDYGDAVVEVWYCDTCAEYHDGDTFGGVGDDWLIDDEPDSSDEDTAESAPGTPLWFDSDDDEPLDDTEAPLYDTDDRRPANRCHRAPLPGGLSRG